MSEPYRHILYYSPSHIRQLFFDRIDENTKITEQKESWSTLKAGLSTFLPGSLGGEIGDRKKVMESVNQSEEHIQTKRVVNHLLEDENIPRIKDLDIDDVCSLYRFSCDCQILPRDNEEAEDATFVEVVGKEGNIEFRGTTSLDNWSSLSDTLMMTESELPFPLNGIIQVQDIQDQVITEELDGSHSLEQATCLVNFVFVCQPDQEEFQQWMNRRSLVGKYHEQASDT
ncbi:hypothetical protein IL252_16875 [Halomicrobium sp. IBSBa]|uniref:hypothetical protein n=1 Tax=Halomicrobium sp. IBSBa TaxID=2778916 RepID=UPI001ABFE096|nr:hypothetical protein [Halomicrobium sp. IBSBa]MBO4249483.1 hypothetical protein [Halomicrobium sp. IBSBa]